MAEHSHATRTACTPSGQLPLETMTSCEASQQEELSLGADHELGQLMCSPKPGVFPQHSQGQHLHLPTKDTEFTPHPAPCLDNPRSCSSMWVPLSPSQTLMSLHLHKTSPTLALETEDVVCASLDASAAVLCKSPSINATGSQMQGFIPQPSCLLDAYC